MPSRDLPPVQAQPRRRPSRLTASLAFLLGSCGGSGKQPPAFEAPRPPRPRPPPRGARARRRDAAPAAPIDSGGFRTAIDLYANRVHAGLHRDGRLVVDAGGLDFLKYVDGGWKTSWLLGHEGRGPPGRAGRGPVGDGVPPRRRRRPGGADATLSITMRALAPAAAGVAVRQREAAVARWRSTRRASATTSPSRRRCCTRATTAFGCTFKSAADVAGGKRAAAAVTSLALGPGAARVRRPARSRRSRRARSTSAARAGARWCRAARARGCRSTCSSRPARTWRSRTAPPARAARCVAQVAVDGKPAAHRARGHRRRGLDRRARRSRRRRRAGRAHRSGRARHEGRPRLGRAARRREGARAAGRRRRRSPSSITSSSGWSTRCAPTRCTPTTRRRAS